MFLHSLTPATSERTWKLTHSHASTSITCKCSLPTISLVPRVSLSLKRCVRRKGVIILTILPTNRIRESFVTILLACVCHHLIAWSMWLGAGNRHYALTSTANSYTTTSSVFCKMDKHFHILSDKLFKHSPKSRFSLMWKRPFQIRRSTACRSFPSGLGRIPFEITILVLSHIHSDLYSTFEGPRLPDYITSLPETEDAHKNTISRARSCLHAVSLVCHAWHHASTLFLYSRVIVLSHHQLSLFRRTIANSPSIASLVKSLSVLLIRGTPSSPSLSYLLLRPDLEEFFGTRAQQDALFVVHRCPSLTSIALRVPNYHPHDPGPALLTLTPCISRLRRLVLHGHVARDFSTQELHHLEVLSLHWVRFNSHLQFPYCPRLHTLQLFHTYTWSDSDESKVLLPSKKLPSLKHLHLHHNSFSIRALRNKITRFFPRLRSIYLVGTYEECAFEALAGSNVFSSLNELVMGSIDAHDHSLADWVLPCSLRTLTIFVDLDQKILSLKVLVRFLRLNELEIQNGLVRLSNIIIHVYWARGSKLASELEEWVDVEMDRVRVICETLGISVQFSVART